MLAVLLLLAAAPHCADPGFCPTPEQFRQVVRARDDEDEWTTVEAANASEEYVLLSARERLLRITDLYCERPGRDEPRSVTCKASFHHPSGIHFRMLILTRRNRVWQVEEQLGVFRKNSAASPCADPAFCPTADELRRAFLLDDDEEFGIVVDDPRPVRGITQIYCGKPAEDPRSILCKATLRYGSGDSFQIARLARGEEHWEVDQRLEVFRKR
jgi:hypothetical protein